MQEEIFLMPNLLKSAIQYGKRYLYRTISDILREWSLDEVLEDNWFNKN